LLPLPTDEEQEEIIVGTEYYISPEMLTEKACSYSADLWALGVIIFKMLTGELPFFGKSTD
jgi:serine/threonine protein kinase